MRVICINNKPVSFLTNISAGLLIEGNDYTVIEATTSYSSTGRLGYFLKEVKTANGAPFDACRFAPLSDINEKEFERNYNKETA